MQATTLSRLQPTKHPLPRTKRPPPRKRHLLPSSPFPTSTNAKRPLTVAVTGGIGAGKSAALEAFARHGAETISADEIVHRILREDADVHSALVERLGEGIVGEDGADRSAIGRVVFNDPDELAW